MSPTKSSLLSRLHHDQQGQIALLAVGVIVASLGFAMIVADFGQWMGDRRDAQNDDDTAVLAAAGELPNPTDASASADNWAGYNGVLGTLGGALKPWSSSNSACSGGTNVGNVTLSNRNGLVENPEFPQGYDTVCATVERESPAIFARFFGKGNAKITTRAAAGLFWLTGACVQPWGVPVVDTWPPPNGNSGQIDIRQNPPSAGDGIIDDIDTNDDGIADFGLNADELYTLHSGTQITPGNNGALAVYGNGDVDYREAIAQPCAGGDLACSGNDGILEAGETVNCPPKTGNLGQTNRDALVERFNYYHPGEPEANDQQCDVNPEGKTAAQQRAALDTLLSNPNNKAYCQYRIVIIPVLDHWPTGASDPVTVYGLAAFYYTYYDRSSPWAKDQSPGQCDPSNPPSPRVGSGDDYNGDCIGDFVAGFYIRGQKSCGPADQCKWDDTPTDFAPVTVLLIQ